MAQAGSIRGGADSAKSASPTSKDVYLATDIGVLYVCFADGAWTNIGNLYLLLAGGTMSGAIAMGTNKITGLAAPTAANDAARKAYVDDNSINNLVEDTSPQLGGDLDLNGHKIDLLAQSIVTGSRSFETVYQNETGGVMIVTVSVQLAASGGIVTASVEAGDPNPNTVVARIDNGNVAAIISAMMFVVPNGSYYAVRDVVSGSSLQYWVEWS